MRSPPRPLTGPRHKHPISAARRDCPPFLKKSLFCSTVVQGRKFYCLCCFKHGCFVFHRSCSHDVRSLAVPRLSARLHSAQLNLKHHLRVRGVVRGGNIVRHRFLEFASTRDDVSVSARGRENPDLSSPLRLASARR